MLWTSLAWPRRPPAGPRPRPNPTRRGEDGDESKKSTTVSTEEKETAQAKADYHRSQAVLAIDVQCYADLHSTLQSLLTGYVCVLDNMEKNESKLRAPKGSSNSMGMY